MVVGANSLALLISLFMETRAQADHADTAIVFAVDVSGSVDPETAKLQREGHATAISSQEVLSAIAHTRTGCVAITYVEWSSYGQMHSVVPWTDLCGARDAQAVAAIIRREGDKGFGCETFCQTSISFAIDLSVTLFDAYSGDLSGKIIDISANGTNNDGLAVRDSRQQAIARGCTINAIAMPQMLRGVEYDLTHYFADNVIGGPNAFVIPYSAPSDYPAALRRKLVREISLSVGQVGRRIAQE